MDKACRGAAIAAVMFLAIVPAADGQRASRATVDAGIDALTGEHASTTGSSYALRLNVAPFAQGTVGFAFGWVTASGSYSPRHCHLARSFYCFGGSESVRAGELALYMEGQPMTRVLGGVLTPMVSFGATRAQTKVSELEGPTALCIENGEVVSCADNPPFQRFATETWTTLPSLSFGLAFTRAVGAVDARVALAAHRFGLTDEGHRRIRLSLGLGF